ncbi:MAG: DUF2281 domain-containing protein [Lamprobacter sp.]|uniref:DUF2281 domain-containing protein n=1 Tax=Lamprobacter sp. TaxID=3100796 RepID=UPI002B25B3F5|nr:DUF2281 domain-containing protein [Lamprobacter sp.]MEA3643852.1 DUF2281 domain-containing protein [Lamprobacter sp.]
MFIQRDNDSEECLPMMICDPQQFSEQMSQLPPSRQAEVLDFIQFLLEKEERALQFSVATSQLSEASLNQVWANEEDAAYDQL